MSEVRINGNMAERIGTYGQWAVEVLTSDGHWNMITTCYGPASLSSAVLIARAWSNGDSIPSPVDAMEFLKKSEEDD